MGTLKPGSTTGRGWGSRTNGSSRSGKRSLWGGTLRRFGCHEFGVEEMLVLIIVHINRDPPKTRLGTTRATVAALPNHPLAIEAGR